MTDYGPPTGDSRVDLPAAPPLREEPSQRSVPGRYRGPVIGLIVIGALITAGSLLYLLLADLSFERTDHSVFDEHANNPFGTGTAVCFLLLVLMAVVAFVLRRSPGRRLTLMATAVVLMIAVQVVAVIAVHDNRNVKHRLRAALAHLPAPTGGILVLDHYTPYDSLTVPTLTTIWTVTGATAEQACEQQRDQITAWTGVDPGSSTFSYSPEVCGWSVSHGRDTLQVVVVHGRYVDAASGKPDVVIDLLAVAPDSNVLTIGYELIAG